MPVRYMASSADMPVQFSDGRKSYLERETGSCQPHLRRRCRAAGLTSQLGTNLIMRMDPFIAAPIRAPSVSAFVGELRNPSSSLSPEIIETGIAARERQILPYNVVQFGEHTRAP